MYSVTRQIYYYSGEFVVEINRGGLDESGADMLCANFPGEAQDYDDPREAVKVAIEILNQWKEIEPDKELHLAYGTVLTCLGSLELEPTTIEDAIQWASKEYESLGKCPQCAEIMPDRDHWFLEIDPDTKYCSEYCADNAYIDYCQLWYENDPEDYANAFDIPLEELI